MILQDENYVQMCEFTDIGEIQFTSAWLESTKELGGHTRTFAAQLIAGWDSQMSRVLDYYGPCEDENDRYTGINGKPMDVREDIPCTWEYANIPISGITTEWHRDIMRSKLVSLKIPERLIKQYVKIFKKNERE